MRLSLSVCAIALAICIWLACIRPGLQSINVTRLPTVTAAETARRASMGVPAIDERWTLPSAERWGDALFLTYEHETPYGKETVQLERDPSTHRLIRETTTIPSGKTYQREGDGPDAECLTVLIDYDSGERTVDYWGDRENVEKLTDRLSTGQATLRSVIDTMRQDHPLLPEGKTVKSHRY